MLQVAVSGGRAAVLDVPEPAVRPGGIRVRTAFSLISVGMESAGLGSGGRETLLLKAIRSPELVRKVFDPVSSQGLLLYARLASVKNPQQGYLWETLSVSVVAGAGGLGAILEAGRRRLLAWRPWERRRSVEPNAERSPV